MEAIILFIVVPLCLISIFAVCYLKDTKKERKQERKQETTTKN
jgi:hypothetical protein